MSSQYVQNPVVKYFVRVMRKYLTLEISTPRGDISYDDQFVRYYFMHKEDLLTAWLRANIKEVTQGALILLAPLGDPRDPSLPLLLYGFASRHYYAPGALQPRGRV